MRFSLRTLFIAVTLMAIGFGIWFNYRRATTCEVRWLKLGSVESNVLFTPPIVAKNTNDNKFEARYPMRYRLSGELMGNLNHVGTIRSTRESLEISCNSDEDAKLDLKLFQLADLPKPGVFVIRGRIENRQHEPLAHATVDLQGPFQFVNHFQTRSDGTFTLPLYDGPMAAPAGSGYFLRIRTAEDSTATPMRWETPYFSLSPDQSEIEAVIVVPQ